MHNLVGGLSLAIFSMAFAVHALPVAFAVLALATFSALASLVDVLLLRSGVPMRGGGLFRQPHLPVKAYAPRAKEGGVGEALTRSLTYHIQTQPGA